MRLLLMRELRAREASALAQLSNSQLRVIHGAELEARVATLEMQLAQEQQKNAAELAEVADQAESAVVDDADTGSSSVTGDGAAWRRSRPEVMPA